MVNTDPNARGASRALSLTDAPEQVEADEILHHDLVQFVIDEQKRCELAMRKAMRSEDPGADADVAFWREQSEACDRWLERHNV